MIYREGKTQVMSCVKLVKNRRGPLLAAGAVLGAVLCASLGAPVASAATVGSAPRAAVSADAVSSGSVDGIPVYRITSSNQGSLSGIHECRELGSDGTTQAVECADLYATPDGSGGVDVSAAAEAYCESGGYPECPNIDVGFNLEQGNGGSNAPPIDGLFCGPLQGGGSCASGARNYNVADGAPIDISGCDAKPGTAYEFWTVDWSGSTIEVPSGKTYTSSSNLSSQHAIICP